MWTFIIIILFLAVVTSQNAEYLDVSLKQGPVRGFLSEDRQRYSFFGIPYATTPMGQDRFKAPLPPPTWTDVLIANNTVVCAQIDDDIYYGVEDCLLATVYVPANLSSDANMPVLVYVHGGGFINTAGNTVAGNMILNQDIIIVTFNYRIGVLGYLCLLTEDVPGNAASKDQIAALRWIQNNIHSFGGNPNDITLYGFSAGSVSVDLLILSGSADGLFNKVILESGSATSSWAMTYDPVEKAKIFVELLGYGRIDDVATLTEIFKNATVLELVSGTWSYYVSNMLEIPFTPCVEKDYNGTAFITDTPINILTKATYKPVPMIVSYMKMEGLMFHENWNNGWSALFDDNAAAFVSKDLLFENNSEKLSVASTIKDFYVNRNDDNFLAFIEMETDINFFYHIIESALLHTINAAPVYLMEFSYYDTNGVIPGAAHAYFNLVAFEVGVIGINGVKASERLSALLGNFVKFGNPTPAGSTLGVTWPAFTATQLDYLSFADNLTVAQSPQPDRYHFWLHLYEQYYRERSLPEITRE